MAQPALEPASLSAWPPAAASRLCSLTSLLSLSDLFSVVAEVSVLNSGLRFLSLTSTLGQRSSTQKKARLTDAYDFRNQAADTNEWGDGERCGLEQRGMRCVQLPFL